MKGLSERQFKISEVEKTDMKMTTIEVQSGLKKCKDIQRRADVALEQLESDTNSYNQEQKKVAWIKSVCSVVLGVGGEH